MSAGFIIAAPHSGSGKTTVTLGLLRALRQRGLNVSAAKAGPDFIDPAFHTIAAGQNCINLDPWAMRSDLIETLVSDFDDKDVFVVEAMMGLFDGAADGSGSAADLAVQLGLPVVLVVDAAKQSHSIAALVSGFVKYRYDVAVRGVILNRVGSKRHELMLREALAVIGVPVFGVVMRNDSLVLPSRHLGLIQAGEVDDIEQFIASAANVMSDQVDIEALLRLKRPQIVSRNVDVIPPLGQNIAVARDEAFAFSYSHVLEGWKKMGAELSFFSPLADEAPHTTSNAVYLPGGYPELHAEKLSENRNFLDALRRAAENEAIVYGECGGYMVLGEGLVDRDGHLHEMAGLLNLVTSFEKRKLHLGYRNVSLIADMPFGQAESRFTAHEFHYSTIVREEGEHLFKAVDARGEDLGGCGLHNGNVSGSYMHLIDQRIQESA